MCSSYQLEIIGMIKLFTNILSERVTSTSWRDTPTTSIIWIRPKQIADWSFSWHFHDSIKLIDLIKGIDGWRQTTMKAEDVSFDNSGQRKVIEKRGEMLPNLCVSVLSKALIIESINLCNLLGLVISSQDSNSLWIPDLETNQERNSLDGVVAPVNVISHEEIVVIW